jgi:hypothetical protein
MMIDGSYAQISQGGNPPSFSRALSASVPTVTLTAVDAEALLAEDAAQPKDVALRFAAELPVRLSLKNSGVWEALGSGDRVWRLRISSADAFTLGLLYESWYLPKNGQLFIYNDARSQVLGAFTAVNNWHDGTNITQPVNGDAITLELLEVAAEFGQTELSISQVNHGYRDLFSRGSRAIDAFGSSGACNNNVNCPEGANWQDEKRGVAMILSGGSRICSGSLINNTALNQAPLFLTANHCLGGETSWVFMFNYESAGCTNVDGPTNQTVANSTRLSTNVASDFALLQLSSAVPGTYNPYFNGWNRVNTASTNSIGIHHPSGDIKKISFDNQAPGTNGWNGAGTDHWQIFNWEDGTTEGGSSGSPLFDQNGRITGQLHGGQASCANNVNDYYGKLAISWAGGGTNATRLSNWLDPGGTAPNTLDGLNGTGGGGGTPPANDLCPGTAIASLPYSTTGSTALANNNYANCVGATSKDVVYSLTLGACTNVTVSTCGSSFDTGLGVRTGGTCPGTTQVGCNDDFASCGTGSQLAFQAAAGTTYWIIVHGYAANSGTFALSVTGTACSGGGNSDVCPGLAISALPYNATGTTATAANNYSNCVGATSRDRVYTLNLTTCRNVTVSLCGTTTYDAAVGVRSGGTCPGTSLVVCNDDFCGNKPQVSFTAQANTNYYIIVHGYSTRSGNYAMAVTGTACASPNNPDEEDLPPNIELAPANKGDDLPLEYSLAQNHPNPFNPSTEIAFDLVESGNVTLRVFNLIGQEVATLVNESRAAGHHKIIFDATNLPSGLYVYELEANGFRDTKKLLLLK